MWFPQIKKTYIHKLVVGREAYQTVIILFKCNSSIVNKKDVSSQRIHQSLKMKYIKCHLNQVPRKSGVK